MSKFFTMSLSIAFAVTLVNAQTNEKAIATLNTKVIGQEHLKIDKRSTVPGFLKRLNTPEGKKSLEEAKQHWLKKEEKLLERDTINPLVNVLSTSSTVLYTTPSNKENNVGEDINNSDENSSDENSTIEIEKIKSMKTLVTSTVDYATPKVAAKETISMKITAGEAENIFSTFGVGYGGASAYPFSNQDSTGTIWMSTVDLALNPNIGSNTYYQRIKNFQPEQFNELQQYLTNSKYLIYWLPKYWSEYWFSTSQIQLAMDNGYTPVFMYWYFGDHLVNGMPTQSDIDAYYANNQKVADFLNKLDGEKIIIMEPEFNKNAIVATQQSQQAFASIISNAITNIKENTPDTLFSLCMTDAGNRGENSTYSSCGYENCALGDQYSWSKPETVYNALLDKIDFVSFQEMVAQFSRDPHNPGTWSQPNPKAYTESEIGINSLAQRINNFTAFLHEKYNKPVFLPYMTIATATWNDANANKQIEEDELDLAGWENKASQVYQDLVDMRGELQSNGMFAYAPMALFDDPSHDKDGYQYFMNNEYHLGITKTGAKDGIDERLHGDLYPKGNILDFIYQ